MSNETDGISKSGSTGILCETETSFQRDYKGLQGLQYVPLNIHTMYRLRSPLSRVLLKLACNDFLVCQISEEMYSVD